MDPDTARTAALDAAESLFYARGVQSVGMDEIRSASGIPLKRLYQLFPSKTDLVEAYLRRRDTSWLLSLSRYADARPDPRGRVLAVFDWLEGWFAEPEFRGCAFVNAFGELGASSPGVVEAVADHKAAFHRYLAELARQTTPARADAARADRLAAQLALLTEGAITTAAITGTSEPARQAQAAARALLSMP
ncbi:TetR/AcrR family transcriptional regulator [Kitasatospora mediocidica]|uniref:TetR/AcrR family transcriptional regulator n=1 Tax=Kitasatospora mediocidica TaxID=58352 RepID=UPI00056258A4|nr:TetR/AcrR family transcriptional regulator [Kitasatospora mediocidica]